MMQGHAKRCEACPDMHLNLISTGKLDDASLVNHFMQEKLRKGEVNVPYDDSNFEL